MRGTSSNDLCGPEKGPQCPNCLGFTKSSDPIGINQVDTAGHTPLSRACQAGHLGVVQFLVGNKADLQKAANNGASPFMMACQISGCIKTVKHLLEQAALGDNHNWFNINHVNEDGKTPLYLASSNGHTSIVRFLLDHGADIHKASTGDNGGWTAFHAACEGGHVEVVKLLREFGVEMNQPHQSSGTTGFYLACSKGRLDVVKYLFEQGVDTNKRNGSSGFIVFENHPLRAAYKNERINVASYLESHNPVNTNCLDSCLRACVTCPLMCPAVYCCLCVKEDRYLTNRKYLGEEFDYFSKFYCFDLCLWPIQLCRQTFCVCCGSLCCGIDIYGENHENAISFAILCPIICPLMWLIGGAVCCFGSNRQFTNDINFGMECLLWARLCACCCGQSCFDQYHVNGTDGDGDTAAHGSAMSITLLSILSFIGADLSIKNRQDSAPIHVAASSAKYRTLDRLMEEGCDLFEPNKKGEMAIDLISDDARQKDILSRVPKDKIPLYYACKFDMVDRVVELLARDDVDVNLSNKSTKRTPIDIATLMGNRSIVRLLLNTGKITNFGVALHHACISKDRDIIRLLLEAGTDIGFKSGNHKTAFDSFVDLASRSQHLLATEFSLNILENKDNAVWFYLIQVNVRIVCPSIGNRIYILGYDQNSDMYGISDRVQFYVKKYPHLVNCKDVNGRTSLEMATEANRRILKSLVCIHGRYTLVDAQAMHSSATCLVYRATDEGDLDHTGTIHRMIIPTVPNPNLTLTARSSNF